MLPAKIHLKKRQKIASLQKFSLEKKRQKIVS
jgi:hypothetical protein